MYIWCKKILHCLPPRPHCILIFWFSRFHLLSLHILDFINKRSCSHLTFSSVSNLLPHMWFMATISTPHRAGAPPEWGHGVLRLLKEFDNWSSRMQEYSSTLICWKKSSHVTIRGLIFLYSLIPVWRCILTPMHYDCHNYGFPWAPSSQNNKTVMICESFSKWDYFTLKFTTNLKVYSITLQNEIAVDNVVKETHSVDFQSIIHLRTVHLSSEAVCWVVVYFVQLEYWGRKGNGRKDC